MMRDWKPGQAGDSPIINIYIEKFFLTEAIFGDYISRVVTLVFLKNPPAESLGDFVAP